MSEDLKNLKQRIFDEGTVKPLLEALGCDTVHLVTGRIGDPLVTARAPNSSNKRGVQVYLSPTLHCEIVNEGVSGDIFSVVAFVLYGSRTFEEVRQNLYQIKTFICNSLDYDDILNQKYEKPVPKTDWNWWLRDIKNERSKEIEIIENPVLNEDILLEYVRIPWSEWYTVDGISLQTQQEFEIGIDVFSERVTIPIRNREGKLIGVKGRYIGANVEILESKKYAYLYPCSKSIELYNLHRALPHITEKKEIIIVEGAKTTMRLWDGGVKNSVSMEGDRVSPVQIKLLREIGLDINYVFAWDKGKDVDFVKKQISQLRNRNVYYLYDNEERFEDKDSPADKGIEVFLDLYNNDKYEFLKK